MRADNKVQITIEFNSKGEAILKNARGDITGLGKNVDKTGRSMGGLSKASGVLQRGVGGVTKSIFSLKGALVGLGIYAVISQMREWVKLSNVQEKAVAGLRQVMVSMGNYSPELETRLHNMASALQDVGIAGDEAILEGTKFLMTYKKIGQDVLPETMKVMVDFAALTGGDMKQAANILGKASMGLTGELSRYGITLSEAAKKTKDFKLILADIEAQVGGQAEALRATDYGGMVAFGNTIGDVKENLGDLVKAGLGPFSEVMNAVFKDLNAGLAAQEKLQAALIRQNMPGYMLGFADSAAAVAEALHYVNLAWKLFGFIGNAAVALVSRTMSKYVGYLRTITAWQAGNFSPLFEIFATGLGLVEEKVDILADSSEDVAAKWYAALVKTSEGGAKLAQTIDQARKHIIEYIKSSQKAGDISVAATKKTVSETKKLVKNLNRLKKAREDALKEAEKKHKAFLAAVAAEHAKTLEGMKQAEDQYWEEVGAAYTDYLDTSKRITEEVYRHRAFKISGQADLLRAAGVDEADIQAHLKEKYVELEQQKLRASDSFFAGVRSGWLGLEQSQMTWAEHGEKVFNTFVSASKTAWSDSFFNILKGDFQDLEDVWSDFLDSMLRAFVDILAQMVTEWVAFQAVTFANNSLGMGLAIPGMAGSGGGGSLLSTASTGYGAYSLLGSGMGAASGLGAGVVGAGGAVTQVGSGWTATGSIGAGSGVSGSGSMTASGAGAGLSAAATAAGIAAAVYVGGTTLESILSPYMGFGGSQAPTQAQIDRAVALASLTSNMFGYHESGVGHAQMTEQEALAVLMAGNFDTGTPYVPRDMIAGIHQGERILTATENRDLVAAMNRMSGGGSAGAGVVIHNVNLQIKSSLDLRNPHEAREVARVIKRELRAINGLYQ